jgi:hypothetical protein
LSALDAQHTQRLNQILLDAAAERMVREDQFVQDRTQLLESFQGRSEQTQTFMDDMLAQETAWWEARMDLIPDVPAGQNAAGGDLPLHLLGGQQGPPGMTPIGTGNTVSIAAGAITIPVTAADGQSPVVVAENVAEVLEGIFGMFQ